MTKLPLVHYTNLVSSERIHQHLYLPYITLIFHACAQLKVLPHHAHPAGALTCQAMVTANRRTMLWGHAVGPCCGAKLWGRRAVQLHSHGQGWQAVMQCCSVVAPSLKLPWHACWRPWTLQLRQHPNLHLPKQTGPSATSRELSARFAFFYT